MTYYVGAKAIVSNFLLGQYLQGQTIALAFEFDQLFLIRMRNTPEE